MKKIHKIAFPLLLFIVFAGCKQNEQSRHTGLDTGEIRFTKDRTLSFYDASGNELKTISIEVAKSPYEQQTRLMYRKSMKENRGMLFVYDRERPRPNFYMKNTYIGLDLVYIDAQKKIVDFNKNAKPLDESLLPSNAPAQYVLEINAGMADKWGLEEGDKVKFQLQ